MYGSVFDRMRMYRVYSFVYEGVRSACDVRMYTYVNVERTLDMRGCTVVHKMYETTSLCGSVRLYEGGFVCTVVDGLYTQFSQSTL